MSEEQNMPEEETTDLRRLKRIMLRRWFSSKPVYCEREPAILHVQLLFFALQAYPLLHCAAGKGTPAFVRMVLCQNTGHGDEDSHLNIKL